MYRLYICQAKDDCPWNIKPPENLSEIIENYNIVYALRSERIDNNVLEDRCVQMLSPSSLSSDSIYHPWNHPLRLPVQGAPQLPTSQTTFRK